MDVLKNEDDNSITVAFCAMQSWLITIDCNFEDLFESWSVEL